MFDGSGNLRGFAKVLRYETERKQAEDQLKKSLHKKELLLREIHHRVKNNLHVISSLLSLQSDQAQDSEVQRVFDELQDRVRSIAILHEALYGSQDLANVDFGPYMQRVVHDLLDLYGIDQERIQVGTEADPVALSSDQALPLGLIVNELVSNALKHAFRDVNRERAAGLCAASKHIANFHTVGWIRLNGQRVECIRFRWQDRAFGNIRSGEIVQAAGRRDFYACDS